MTVKVRFAPSPTGKLHVGNARTALINWLYARRHGGHFLLRVDDTDAERCTPEYESAIRDDLQWLGLSHDAEFRQSDRTAAYEKAIVHLKDTGRLYPCFETPSELALKRKTQLSRGVPPLYDRAGLSLSAAEIRQYHDEGRKPHWRFKLEDIPIQWDDLCRGSVAFQGTHLSDPVLVREDGRPIYTLSSVVDDLDAHITHIIRGEDHVANTAVQIQLMQALGGDPCQFSFAHLNLLTGAGGEPLSKRLGSLSIENLRETGIDPLTINSFLAKLGTSDSIQPYARMEALVAQFDLSHFTRASPKFSQEALLDLNEKLMHNLTYDQVKDRLEGVSESFWQLVQGNITKLEAVKTWHQVCVGTVKPVIHGADKAYIEAAARLLPDSPWDEGTFKQWTQLVKQETGRKGKNLFMPLRQALTGLDHGPSLGGLLLEIGYHKAQQRLSGKTV